MKHSACSAHSVFSKSAKYLRYDHCVNRGSILAIVSFTMFAALLGGCSKPKAELHSVPRAAVDKSTLAILKIHLNKDIQLSQLAQLSISSGAPANLDMGKLAENLRKRGVEQIALCLGGKAGIFGNLGLYLGGNIPCSNEEVENAIIESGAGSMWGVASLLTAVTDVGGGWRFFGVGSTGESPDSSREISKRYEKAFAESKPAMIQLVILKVPSSTAIPHMDNQPRLVRRLTVLKKVVEATDWLYLGIEPTTRIPSSFRANLQAHFDSIDDAKDFARSWSGLAADLALATGPEDMLKVQGHGLMALLAKGWASTTPVLDGKTVTWSFPVSLGNK